MRFKLWLEFVTPPLQTPGAQVRFGIAGMKEAFEITPEGAVVRRYIQDYDFPGQPSSPTRGSLFYVEVPRELRRKGIGTLLSLDALSIMKSNGSNTVAMNPVSGGGAGVIDALVRRGAIRGPIQRATSGVMEFEIA